MRTVTATRYVTPLREGGSLPALVEADDHGLYVVKLRGAGQGPKALVAEWVAGELARAAGLRVPELVRVEVDPALGRNEPDGEIRDLLKASAGPNLGLDFLPGSVTFDPAVGPPPEADEAADLVFLDALVTNVDPSSPEVVVKTFPKGGGPATTETPGLAWPPQFFSLSHLALPFAPDDPVFGWQPDPSVDYGVRLGTVAPRGERDVLITPLDSLLRLNANPFFSYEEKRVLEVITSEK